MVAAASVRCAGLLLRSRQLAAVAGFLSACGPGILVGPAPCTGSGQCAAGVCVAGAAAPECVSSCADEDDCDAATTCALSEDIDGDPITICSPPRSGGAAPGAVCTTSDDCANGLCHEGFCVEICTACSGGYSCDEIATPFAGADVAVHVCEWGMDWGAMELGAVATPSGGSAEIGFDIAAGTASFIIVLIDDDGLRVAVASLIAPDGTVLIDIQDGAADLNPGFNFPGSASTLVPSTDDPAARPQAGTYRLIVGTYDPANWTSLDPLAGDMERVVIVPEALGEEGGLLDLNLHFAPGTGIVPADAPSEPFVSDMLAEMESIFFATAGIRLGAISYGETLAEHDIVEDSDEIRALLASSTDGGANGTAVNIFLVTDITFTSGYSAGRPGPPGIYATPSSGLVAELLGSGRDTGVLLAHETSHFLGLYHTTEIAGGSDPIGDTPVCSSGTATVDCPDFDNLMFPLFPLDRPLGLTDGQRTVLRNNPSLYEVARSGACPSAGPTYDVTAHGFATGDTSAMADNATGSCGGSGAPERLNVYRARKDLSRLDLRITGRDFAPAVYVRQGECGESAFEIACDSANAGNEVLLSLDTPAPGVYFIFVDGRDGGGGTFTLELDATPN